MRHVKQLDSWLEVFANFAIITVIASVVWCIATLLETFILAWIKIFQIIPFNETLNPSILHAHSKADALLALLNIEHSRFFLYDTQHTRFQWLALLSIMLIGAIMRSILLHFQSWRDAIGNGVTETYAYFGKAALPQTTFTRCLRRIVMTTLSLISGGSGGLEGPIIPIGESIGSGLAKLFKVNATQRIQLYQITGVASGLAALLNAPFTAALFASEVFLPEKMTYRFMIYSLFAAVVVYTLNMHVFGHFHVFLLTAHSKYYSFKELILVCLIAIFFSAPAGYALAKMQILFKNKFQQLPTFSRAPIGALILFALVYSCWQLLGIQPYHVIGMGEISLIEILNNPTHLFMQSWWVVLILVFIKMFATSITLQSGGSVGLLIPSMYMGGMTGYGMFLFLQQAHLMQTSAGPDLYIITGIASALVTIVEVPLAAIALVIELFGASYGPPTIISVIICYKIINRNKK